MTKKEADKLQIIQGRINRGTIVDQKAWRFFISDEGASFDAGLAERAISAQKGIKACGIVPEYNKMIHETEPALYVETDSQCAGGYRVVRKAVLIRLDKKRCRMGDSVRYLNKS